MIKRLQFEIKIANVGIYYARTSYNFGASNVTLRSCQFSSTRVYVHESEIVEISAVYLLYRGNALRISCKPFTGIYIIPYTGRIISEAI